MKGAMLENRWNCPICEETLINHGKYPEYCFYCKTSRF